MCGHNFRGPNADALEFWAGLTPDLKESAGRVTTGKITKAGSKTLRWALGKAAGCLCQSDAVQERIRQRIIVRCGGLKPKANVAMARRLLGILLAMTRSGATYHVGQPVNRAARANKIRLSNKRSTPGTPVAA